MMHKISQSKFQIYTAFTKNPAVSLISKEIAWYENENRTIAATIIEDTDAEYHAIIFGRNEIGAMGFVDIFSIYDTIEEAEAKIFEEVKKYEAQKKTVFVQGKKQSTINLFQPIAQNKNPSYIQLDTSRTYTPAKELIKELMPYLNDIDGNFVDQFQSKGFDSRLWELYLLCYFNEEQLIVERDYNAPDFMISRGDLQIGVEAVTAARKEATKGISSYEELVAFFNKDIDIDQMAITWGSPLYSKLKKKTKIGGLHYWEYEHTKNKPFVIAIADFSNDFSMTRSNTSLVTYLYGQTTADFKRDENGHVVPTPNRIEKHVGTKEIPSGFFHQDNTEHISAIITSSSATLSKFNRIGKECGFGDKHVRMFREGNCIDPDPKASKPLHFLYEVVESEGSEVELWAEGVEVYHNPNALYPLPLDFFQLAINYQLEDNIPVANTFHDLFRPFGSVTVSTSDI